MYSGPYASASSLRADPRTCTCRSERVHRGRVAEQYSTGELARLSHVSVRTLHHYDDVGLLRPSGRTAAGHRRYELDDLARLREILLYRALGFPLEEIRALLDSSPDGVEERLRTHHRRLREHIGQLAHMLTALEKEMEALQMGISLSPDEQFEIFGAGYDARWHDEAEQRWADTEAWRQSQARTVAFTKQDWLDVTAAMTANEQALAGAMRAGEPADGLIARQLAEQHRAGVSRFWDCNHAAHRALAEMYVADERFTRHYEDVAPGLAQYVHDAIGANAAAHGA
jgi:DNA-binding transcriptional MerR regulator